MTSHHIGLLSADPAALAQASRKPFTPPVVSPYSVSSRTILARSSSFRWPNLSVSLY